jgi:hypothetical protein
MQIDGLVVCVDYWRELSLSINRWKRALDSITIVTSESDLKTRTASRLHLKTACVWTQAFYAGGGAFNKAAAMQEAIVDAHPWRDWVLLFDADIIPPVDLREQLESADLHPGYLYGAKRHQAHPDQWEGDPDRFPILNDREIPGYFQLFHVTDPAVADRAHVLPTQYYHAGNYDSELQNRWGHGSAMDRKRWLDFHVLHIGSPGKHWCGRDNDEAMKELHAARAAGKRWTDETIERREEHEHETP